MLENSIFHGSQAPVDMESDDICWICLDGTVDRDPLVSPCRCPRKVHPRCLARWQLQQAGRPEETNCRFCQCNLADWKASLTPENLKPEVQRVQPIMVVYFEGQIHRIPVKQGPDGLKEFTHRIRELFRLPDDVDISLTFGCKEPLSGQHLKLEGIGAFDAAVHCASVAAAERQQKLKSSGGSSDAGGPVGPGGAAAVPTAPGAGPAPAHPPSSGGVLETTTLPNTTDASTTAGAPTTTTTAPTSSNSASSPTHLLPAHPLAASRQRLHTHYQQQLLHHQQQLLHYHRHQLERSVSAIGAVTGGLLTSSSAPASAQTSGGGSDGIYPGLHAAASAPVLSHYASETSPVSPPATATAALPASSPLEQQQYACSSSFPGCGGGQLTEQPSGSALSARTSSGGNTVCSALPPPAVSSFALHAPGEIAAASPPSHAERPALQQPQPQLPVVPSSSFVPSLMSASPFQAAAFEAGRISPSATSCLDNEVVRLGQQLSQDSDIRPRSVLAPPPPQQQRMLASQQTAPGGSGSSGSGIMAAAISELSGAACAGSGTPLAAAISEPVPSRFMLASSPSGAASSNSQQLQPEWLPAQQHPYQQQQQQQNSRRRQPSCGQIQNPVDSESPCNGGFPYAGLMPLASTSAAPSRYASPLLPPLATSHAAGILAAQQHREQQRAAAAEAAALVPQAVLRPPSSPTPSASVPPTPRDHYVVERDLATPTAAPQDSACASQPTPSASTQGECSPAGLVTPDAVAPPRLQAFGLPQLPPLPPLPPQQHPCPVSANGPSSSSCLAEQQQQLQQPAAEMSGSADCGPAASPSCDLDSVASGTTCPEAAAGPATPVQPAARRATASPTASPVPLAPPATPVSPTVAFRPSSYSPRQASGESPATEATSPRGLCGGAGAPHRSSRRNRSASSSSASSSHQARHEQDLAMHAGSDDAAVMGSLTGRLKYSLITFSRKVVRSLNFQRGHGAGAACPGAYPTAAALAPVSEVEAVAAAEAEAQVGAAGGRLDGASVADAAAAGSAVPAGGEVAGRGEH